MNQDAMPMSYESKQAVAKSSFLPITKMHFQGMLLVMAISLAYVTYETQFVKSAAPEVISVKRSAQLVFKDGQNGEIVIEVVKREGEKINIIKEMSLEGEQGFLRGILRAMARERIKRQLSPAVPFELKIDQEDHLSLNDPLTKSAINLDAFGPDNVGVFIQIMDVVEKTMAKNEFPNSNDRYTKERK